jgi:nucleotide-binding universal stress UspA family protein
MTHTRGAMRLLDSSTNDRGAPAPVVVVGVDGSPTSWDAFAWGADEVSRTAGTLIAVYVAPTVEPGAEFGAPISYGAAEDARDEMVAQLQDEVERRARARGVPLRFIREIGDTAHALTRVSRSLDADLIVVGKSSKILHHLAGSLGRRLVARHDGPAIVVVP